MFKVIIVEDEKPVLELMKVIIGRNGHYDIVGAFSNGHEALERLPELRPDIAFLDVEMPKMNGLELAQRLNEISEHTRVVFTTAYKDYAVDAFKVYAFDYLLKPVTPDAIERLTHRLLKLERPAAAEEKQERGALVRCLGGFDVRSPDGTVVRWPTRKTEELFAYFLCHPKQDMSKWQLADMLWPDMPEDRGSHNLHNTIYRLKKLLKEQEIGMDIVKTNDGYMLDPLQARYDLIEFQIAVREGSHDYAQAERACSLYRGSLLDRKDYLWKSQLEEGYAKQYTALLRSLASRDMADQAWGKAEQRMDVYLSIYPLDEDMNQLLMDVYASSGRPERALKHFSSFDALYRQELGVELPKAMRDRVSAYL
ncbi:response regulator [Paenibacillus planticolens]|uniref:Response regulator n=1 Tax=Paenibacillus planticolens TaxID=2654976 RepID=A0ABX1ZN69_9BACL|nr:response regulator [Paenibacillus planticolens]NOV01013.1 response regulator [Paenibacillus planticolens]